MINIGDRVVVVGGNAPELIGSEGVVIGEYALRAGYLKVDIDGYDARNDGYKNKGVASMPRDLRRIDDDSDEIPANIRAIFTDKCDETLPEVTHEIY